MRTFRLLAALLALACLPSAAHAQSASSASAPAGTAPMQSPCVVQSDLRCYAVGPTVGLPTRSATATSTPCVISATATAITPTGCTASGSAGVYVAGAFSPQAGFPVRLVTTGTWTGSIAVGTSVDSCATVNPLTVAGSAWGTYTGNANEAVDVPPTTGGVAYCLSVTVTSGTMNAALRQ